MNSNSSRSANSSGKSKRSHVSNSNSANKKRTPDQKTLGMAWGANALSSSKTSSRKSPFIDFGSYMVEKNRKLQNQFDTDASSTSFGGDPNAVKPLFNGVSIFVDGFTVPSNQELRSYMLKYGGRYENYFSRSRVTHIICSNLPDSKLKNIRSFSRGLPVVKPMWILDCVAANKLLNWVPYQLDQLVNATHKQTKLSTFFARKSSSTADNAETPLNSRVQPETDSPMQSDAIAEEITCEVGESLKYDSECSGEVSSSGGEKCCELTNEESAFIDEKSSELREGVQNSTDIKDEKIVPAEFESSLYRSSASANDCLNDQKVHTSCNPRSAVSSSSNEYHSTRGDPNFVENYFKSSRLHFIGTWRKRYRKRFPSSTANVKNDNPTKAQRTAILHVDMDCFFVAVVIRDHPELQDKPVAVCHSDSPRGTAEISSANYPARDYGVRAGIFVRDAKALCPHLVILPYNFTAYEEVADQFYNILHKYCNKVQAVSCDEAFLDVTDREDEDPEHIASVIRKEIIETTGCTASAGVSGNMLMARLATRAAKPNGQCYISPEKVESFLDDLPIKALPGIGRVLEEKLKKLYIETCSQLRAISKESLRRDFGAKTGDMLWNYSRGIDNRQVGELQETKSVGAEVNWGVRFNDFKDSQNFLVNLCNEVASRLQECGVQGRTITLKVKKRRSNAGEPTKYMGCGECDNLSHSMTVPIATDEADVLQRISKQLFSSFQLDVKEIRGMGMQVTRLESADMGGQGRERNALRTWLASAPVITKEASCSLSERVDEGAQRVDGKFKTTLANHGEKGPDGNSSYFFSKSTASCRMQTNQSSNETSSRGGPSTLPPIVDLDMGVIESLPPEIFSEMNEMYGGKLSEFIDRKNGKGVCTLSTEEVGGGKKGKGSFIQHYVHLDKATNKYKKSSDTDAEKVHQGNNAEINMAVHWSGKQKLKQESQCLAASEAGTSNLRVNTIDAAHVDVMPASLSQVDISILQQLPEELKVDILESLPAHRGPELSGDSPMVGREPSFDIARMKDVENNSGGLNSVSRNNLWVGSPPEWVDKFDASNHLILNVFADMYNKCRPPCLLSSILQRLISVLPLLMDASNDLEDEAVSRLCELLRQYIELNIKNDMEEIYLCFRLLRRFFLKSRVFFQVYDRVLPYLQVRLVADGIVSSVRTNKNPAPFIADPVVQNSMFQLRHDPRIFPINYREMENYQ